MQLIGAIVWLVIEPPDTKEIYPYPLTAVLTCRVSTFSLMMSLVYNMVLILMCTLYAFKTRKMPANFNEAKYIGFTMYSTCIVWLAFVPIYFGTNNDYKVTILHFLDQSASRVRPRRCGTGSDGKEDYNRCLPW